ncbi:MAG: LysM domain-containing protein [Actinomycetota bacterium]
MSRGRRKQPPPFAHYAAPVAFLAAVTAAVLLVHSALDHRAATTTTTNAPVQTVHATTTRQPAAPHGTAKRFYTVQSGDTFGSIASKEGITVEQLQSLNPGVSSNALQVGQKLRIK